MATYRKRGGKWRAEVRIQGVYDSETFDSKQAAVAWAARRESEIHGGRRGEIPNLTVKDLLIRYERDVSAKKKGYRWESIRLNALGLDRIASVKLRQLDAPHASDWQQRRLQAVSEASVRRERNLLNNVFEIARKEWHWVSKNPFEGIRRPKSGRSRTRVATQEELNRLTEAASDSLKRAIIVAVETGMRAGEIASRPTIAGRVAYLADTKNGEFREVPLSLKAVEAFEKPINLGSGSISAMFARLCDELKIENLTFHDLRHTACTRLAKKLTLLELCKMMGWKDPRHALIYYNEGAASIAEKL